MTNAQAEALDRATQGMSLINYPTIIREFMARGIPADEIIPRVNVFTYQAWLAKGRQVKKGEHGVKVITWIPVDEKKNAQGIVTRKAGKRPWSSTVFHISQTDERTV